MDIEHMERLALSIVTGVKDILAADESRPTIRKRLTSINVQSTEEVRRRYRELLFTTAHIESTIGGVPA